MLNYKTNEEYLREVENIINDWENVGNLPERFLNLRQADRQAVRLETLEEVEGLVEPEQKVFTHSVSIKYPDGEYDTEKTFPVGYNQCRSEFLSNITKLKDIQK